jgi:hypothetical protein
MDRALAGLDFFVCLDELMVSSCSVAKHLMHQQLLFEQPQKFGLVIKGE